MTGRSYLAIDLKSFYASVECKERGLDPLNTNLVVADAARTEKTICLAVSPSLKAHGISGRARLFEVIQRVKEVNQRRKYYAPNHSFTEKSILDSELKVNPALELDFIAAPPRMALYMEYSTKIYRIYLRYIAPEDIHVYSVDEVFIDVTAYLATYKMTAHELAMTMIRTILRETGIVATAGIGTNLYLAKIAMDIVAKHIPADEQGVRIAELDELSYRKQLWSHRPLTDFWRVGRGYAKKLEEHGIFTMGDVARCSIGKPQDFYKEDLLYDLFGVNAELLIDHAWGWESCTMKEIKAYRAQAHSLGSGQVLQCPYDFEKAKMIVREMTELLVLELVEKDLVTSQLSLTIGYDVENLKDESRRKACHGNITTDHYGRNVPKPAHGTANVPQKTSSTKCLMKAMLALYDEIVNPNLLIRRLNVTANDVTMREEEKSSESYEQLDLFTDYEKVEQQQQEQAKQLERERKMQEAMLAIKKKYGKNAILKGTNLQQGATTIERNRQIGGHKA